MSHRGGEQALSLTAIALRSQKAKKNSEEGKRNKLSTAKICYIKKDRRSKLVPTPKRYARMAQARGAKLKTQGRKDALHSEDKNHIQNED